MKNWLAVESVANWQTDRVNGFRYLGVAESRVQKAKQVRAGDIIFIYLPSPIRAFADIRLVEKDGLARSSHVTKYDIACYTGIFTKPLVVIEKTHWLPLPAVKDSLSFGRQAASGMRVSFRELQLADAKIIVRIFKNTFPALNIGAVDEMLAGRQAFAKV